MTTNDIDVLESLKYYEEMNRQDNEPIKNPLSIDTRKALAAQRVLMDNGIDADETAVVLQALGYVLADQEWEDVIEWDKDNIPYENSIWE